MAGLGRLNTLLTVQHTKANLLSRSCARRGYSLLAAYRRSHDFRLSRFPSICHGVSQLRQDEQEDSHSLYNLESITYSSRHQATRSSPAIAFARGSALTVDNSAFYVLKIRNQSSISTSSHNGPDQDLKDEEKHKRSKKRRKQISKAATGMKDLFKKYGWTFIGTYVTVYFVTLTTLFVGINWGWMDPPSLTLGDWGGSAETILEGIGVSPEEASEMKQRQAEGEGISQKWIVDKLGSYEWSKKYADKLANNPSWINLGVAWVATKFTEPIRFGVAVAITPRVARWLGQAPKDEEDLEEEVELVKDPQNEKDSKTMQAKQ